MPPSRRAIGPAVAFVAIAALGGFTVLRMRSAAAAEGAADDSAAVALRVAADGLVVGPDAEACTLALEEARECLRGSRADDAVDVPSSS